MPYLPPEILILVAEHLESPKDISNFVVSCPLLSQCGIDAMYRSCDLSKRHLQQPPQLLRTLLEAPDLGRKIKSLNIWLPDHREDHFNTIEMFDLPGAHAGSLLSLITRLKNTAQRTWALPVQHAYWPYLLQSGSYMACVCALLKFMPMLEHLEICNLDDFMSLRLMDSLAGAEDGVPLILERLKSLKIVFLQDLYRTPFMAQIWKNMRLLSIPRFKFLKSLELTMSPLDQRLADHGGVPHSDIFSIPMEGLSGVMTLTLNGELTGVDLQNLLSHFAKLRKFTYRPYPMKASWHAYTEELWDALLIIRGTLRSFHLQCPSVTKERCRRFWIWPRNLRHFPELRELELVGVIPDVTLVNNPSPLDYFSPALEHLTVGVDKVNLTLMNRTGDPEETQGLEHEPPNAIPGLQDIFDLSYDVPSTLQSITLGRWGILGEIQRDALSISAEKVGVSIKFWDETKFWNVMEQNKVTKPWDPWSVVASVKQVTRNRLARV